MFLIAIYFINIYDEIHFAIYNYYSFIQYLRFYIRILFRCLMRENSNIYNFKAYFHVIVKYSFFYLSY